MRKGYTPERALLFFAVLYSDEGFYETARARLTEEFGELLFESERLAWAHSEYYRDELGWPITRRFIFLGKGFDTGLIRDVKLRAIELEELLSVGGRRSVNIDPGYLTEAKVVLATTKNYPHRIHLGGGIYAEVTLFFSSKGGYTAHRFTYRDYGAAEYLSLFHRMREVLRKTVPPCRPGRR
ncbi:MAG: DUF4416 family protein [Nitrospirae bacterium]|nr:DUF4416 family protein [Nitrospirota bacterium]